MKQHQKNCKVCNSPFVAKRSDAMYCDGACKQRGFLKKNELIKLDSDLLLRQNSDLKKLIQAHIDAEDVLLKYLPEQFKILLKGLNDIGRWVIKDNNHY